MILFNRNDSLMSDLLTPTGGSNLTFKVSFYFCISNDYLTFVTLAWSTKPGCYWRATALKSLVPTLLQHTHHVVFK